MVFTLGVSVLTACLEALDFSVQALGLGMDSALASDAVSAPVLDTGFGSY